MANRIDARAVQQQIANMYLQYPELRDDDEMLKVDMLEGATDLHEMMTVIVEAIDAAEAREAGAKSRVDHWRSKKSRAEMQREFLRGMALKIMQAADLKTLRLPTNTLSQRASQPQIVGEPDVNVLPTELLTVVIKPDLVAIREALLRGDTVPGVFLGNAPPTLTIR